MNLASRELADEIGGPAVGDVDRVETQLFCGSSRLVGLGTREPSRVGPVEKLVAARVRVSRR
jgi:hypothetical protein